MSSCQERNYNTHKNAKNKQTKKPNCIRRDRASEPDMAGMLALSDWEFKTTVMNMLRSLRDNLFKIVIATTYLIMHVYVYF